MITLTIDNPELERIFYEDFHGDNTSFVEFLSQSCQANNIFYQLDTQAIEAMIEEGEKSGDSGLTHEEVWDRLFTKYDKN